MSGFELAIVNALATIFHSLATHWLIGAPLGVASFMYGWVALQMSARPRFIHGAFAVTGLLLWVTGVSGFLGWSVQR